MASEIEQLRKELNELRERVSLLERSTLTYTVRTDTPIPPSPYYIVNTSTGIR
jgi:hypothetical protein